KRTPPGGAVLQYLRADDVGGHEIGRELDAFGIESQDLAQCLNQEGLGEPRHADEQRMTAREDGDERALDHRFLAKDDRGGCLHYALDALGGRLDAADDGILGLRERGHDPQTIRWAVVCESSLPKDGHNMNSPATGTAEPRAARQATGQHRERSARPSSK